MPKLMPVLFVGHGSPMNAIEDNPYSRGWAAIAKQIPKPAAILSISAHWYTERTRIMDTDSPPTIYDMSGFPDELYQVVYRVKGSPDLAHRVKSLVRQYVKIDNKWGIDHGTWSVLHKMYPAADIPVLQLSVDKNAGPAEHFQIGRELGALRKEGVLLLGSGNVVHNLEMARMGMYGGYPWAVEFDRYIKEKITRRQYDDVIHYERAGESSELAFFTPEHFYPLLYILGASGADDALKIFNDSCTLGAISMTSYLLGTAG